ncbi:GNAT family N-acetyltransferase [Streptomyces solicathayae]|uniref:GNAT family N-acetyltransferase n=1 Tax=Streptomyces solicathayae TaxID=3081768 RepID=A0ABZ0LZ63_9ACTN|nr:GNAT family N-acetyltransferase [Streptomyces sp. HUAS YS2]WOX24732.1 GNAT family N-acetyltransferase [Streptomyces sp. HUAS YS2]
MKIESVVTERLLLHPLSVAEAERIVEGEALPGDRWAKGYPEDGSRNGGRGFLRGCAERGDPGVYRAYEIRRREDGFAIGGIGFHGPPDEERFATVGYSLVPDARGQGYAREALGGLIGIARDAGAAGVKGDANLDNLPSQRVMEAAGMTYAGEDERVRYYRLEFAAGTGSA